MMERVRESEVGKYAFTSSEGIDKGAGAAEKKKFVELFERFVVREFGETIIV